MRDKAEMAWGDTSGPKVWKKELVRGFFMLLPPGLGLGW